MTPIEEMIKLLQAVAEGKTLQFIDKHGSRDWVDASPDWHSGIKRGAISIAVERYNWRIKPEPKVVWVNEYHDGYPVAYPTKDHAKLNATSFAVRVAVKYQEVL